MDTTGTTRELHATRREMLSHGLLDMEMPLRVAIGLLADAPTARAFVRAWLAAGCPPERLGFYALASLALDTVEADESQLPLTRLGRHGVLASWILSESGQKIDHVEGARRERNADRLLQRLAEAGPRYDWSEHAQALGSGYSLGIIPLASFDADVSKLLRPLLAHAERPVRVCDLPS